MDITTLLCEFLKNTDISPFVWRYYINKFEPAFSMASSHLHKAAEIIYVIDGTGFMEFNRETVKIQKNNCLIISSCNAHKFFIEKDTTCTLINIHLDYNETVLCSLDNNAIQKDNLSFFPGVVFNNDGFIKLVDYNHVEMIMKKIVSEMENKQDNSNILVKIYFCELFIIISRIVESQNLKKGDMAKQHISKAMKFIDISLAQDLSPEVVAKEIHISPDYLLHIFKDFTSVTLMEYINDKRIEKSKDLLVNTKKKITDIAHQVGIQSSQYFSTLFKKLTSMTPNEYRKSAQMINNSDTNIFK